jgi:hypothetical protein
MHYTFFLPFRTTCFIPDQYSVIIDKAEILAQQGHQIDIVYCDGKTHNVCYYNCHADTNVCKQCKRFSIYLLNQLSKDKLIRLVPISNLIDKNLDYSILNNIQYKNISDIKKIEYKQSKIGYAALSDYLSMSRNLFPLIDKEFIDFFNPLLVSAAKMTDAVLTAIKTLKPDIIGIFNSRTIYSRPIADICKYYKIPFIAFEIGFDSDNFVLRKEFLNCDVHDINYNNQLINKYWESADIPLEEKIKASSNFFMKRRQGIPCADKVYTSNQVSGLLPKDWDHTKQNIVIFNSSEDEMASLGEEYDKMFLFPSQYQGIKYIFDKFENHNDIHFYLRIHPNLKDIPYAYHKRLYDFDHYNNVSIIPGDSEISTYTLIDNADKIITFGSTTGIEAAFVHKPVILLGYCLYSFLDVAYVAKSQEELEDLINVKQLPPKDNTGALKLAYYRMNNEFDHLTLFTNHKKIKVKIFNHNFILTKFKIKNKWLSKYYVILYEILGKYAWLKSNHSFPTKEQPFEELTI